MKKTDKIEEKQDQKEPINVIQVPIARYQYEIQGAVKIIDGLYLGDQYAAQDLDFVFANQVTRIINCSLKRIPNYFEDRGIRYISYNWLDNDTQKIFDPQDQVVNVTFRFIQEALNNVEGILVHSQKGMNRSVCVIGAYMMQKFQWPFYQVLEFLQFRRPDLNLKNSFMTQLLSLEEKVFKIDGNNLKLRSWVVNPNTSDKAFYNEELLISNTFINAQTIEKYAQANQPDDAEESEKNQNSDDQNAKKIRWVDEVNGDKSLVTSIIPPYQNCKFKDQITLEIDNNLKSDKVFNDIPLTDQQRLEINNVEQQETQIKTTVNTVKKFSIDKQKMQNNFFDATGLENEIPQQITDERPNFQANQVEPGIYIEEKPPLNNVSRGNSNSNSQKTFNIRNIKKPAAPFQFNELNKKNTQSQPALHPNKQTIFQTDSSREQSKKDIISNAQLQEQNSTTTSFKDYEDFNESDEYHLKNVNLGPTKTLYNNKMNILNSKENTQRKNFLNNQNQLYNENASLQNLSQDLTSASHQTQNIYHTNNSKEKKPQNAFDFIPLNKDLYSYTNAAIVEIEKNRQLFARTNLRDCYSNSNLTKKVPGFQTETSITVNRTNINKNDNYFKNSTENEEKQPVYDLKKPDPINQANDFDSSINRPSTAPNKVPISNRLAMYSAQIGTNQKLFPKTSDNGSNKGVPFSTRESQGAQQKIEFVNDQNYKFSNNQLNSSNFAQYNNTQTNGNNYISHTQQLGSHDFDQNIQKRSSNNYIYESNNETNQVFFSTNNNTNNNNNISNNNSNNINNNNINNNNNNINNYNGNYNNFNHSNLNNNMNTLNQNLKNSTIQLDPPVQIDINYSSPEFLSINRGLKFRQF